MVTMSRSLRFFFTLCGVFATVVHGYGYKYQYNPISKECQLMLSVPGKPDPISLSGSSTDSRYSENYPGIGGSYSPSLAASSSVGSYNKGQSNTNSFENSKYGGYEEDYDRRPAASSATSSVNNNFQVQSQYEIEREQQLLREREIERERLREIERERERERLKEIEKEREIEKRLQDRELEKRLKEREIEKRLREREQERERLREQERQRERETQYEQSKKVTASSAQGNYNSGYDNRYPSSAASSSYEEPFPSKNRPEDIYSERDPYNGNRNKHVSEASSSLNFNKQGQQQSSQSVQESGYGGNRFTGTSSLSNYNTREPSPVSVSSSVEDSGYGGNRFNNNNRESSAEESYIGNSNRYTPSPSLSSNPCSGTRVYSEALGKCVDKIVSLNSSNKKQSSSTSQQSSSFNEESTSYGSSAKGSGSSALGGLGGLSGSGTSIASKLADFDYNEGVLAAHNNLRAKHGVNALILDESMSYLAQQHAVRLASGASFEHSQNAKSGKFGENIAVRSGGLSPSAVTNIWYKEHLNYDYSFPELVYNPKKSNVRFTAIVWKSTTKLGVGKATDINGKTYVVTNYWPPGNYEGLLTENVFPPVY